MPNTNTSENTNTRYADTGHTIRRFSLSKRSAALVERRHHTYSFEDLTLCAAGLVMLDFSNDQIASGCGLQHGLIQCARSAGLLQFYGILAH